MDDSLLYDTGIASNLASTCAFLERCSLWCIMFNPKKFTFAKEEVDYHGFRHTKEGIKLTADFLNNIRSFPSPTSITDVRSFYGAVNQISYTFLPHHLPCSLSDKSSGLRSPPMGEMNFRHCLLNARRR